MHLDLFVVTQKPSVCTKKLNNYHWVELAFDGIHHVTFHVETEQAAEALKLALILAGAVEG